MSDDYYSKLGKMVKKLKWINKDDYLAWIKKDLDSKEYTDEEIAKKYNISLCRIHRLKRQFKRKPMKRRIQKRLKLRIDNSGYPTIFLNGSRRRIHRLVVENYLGRLLKPNEEIHHINGDKLIYRLDNLLLIGAENHKRLFILASAIRILEELKYNVPQELYISINKIEEDARLQMRSQREYAIANQTFKVLHTDILSRIQKASW